MTGDKTGVKVKGGRGLASKMVQTICWRSFFEYLTTKASVEPELTNKATTDMTAGVGARNVTQTGVQQSVPLLRIPLTSLSSLS